MERTAFFAGSFDPFTVGHASVVERSLPLFDRIVIAIGINPAKTTAVEAERRAKEIAALYADEARVSVMTYDGLTVDAARRAGECARSKTSNMSAIWLMSTVNFPGWRLF